jgi:hypothetical protein
MTQVVINTKLVGRRGPLLSPICLQMNEVSSTVGELLASVVREQVRSFRDRQDSRRLVQILTERQITDGLEAGRFISGSQDLQQPVDVDQAIQAAQTAFEDGLFFLFIGDNQLTSLQQEVELGESTEALFVRLVSLVGG